MTTIHEQQGLRIWKNSKNHFVIARLHYTADPRKRAPEWKEAAQRGLSKARFEQEFEINYNAHLGEKVFPEMQSRRMDIVTRTGPFEFNQWPHHLPMWGGFDYGQKNPSSFHVYTIVDQVVYAIWEMYEPCRNITDFSAALKQCPFWNQIKYIAHDPDMASRKSMDLVHGAISVKTLFEKLGINRWLTGNNDEQAWLLQMQKHWCGPEITFKILESCPRMIDEFTNATYVSMTERQLENANYREGIVDKNNHAMDDCKYFMNSAPTGKVRQLKLPNLAMGYGWTTGSGSESQSSPNPRFKGSLLWQ